MNMKLPQQLQIFLLYSHSDQKAVHRLYRRLVKTGASVWLDKESLLPGQDWMYEIHQAIQKSDFIIACISKEFNKQGGFRHEELKIALERAKAAAQGEVFIIPARLEKCDTPEPLRRWQWVDLFEADGYKKLIETLKYCVVESA